MNKLYFCKHCGNFVELLKNGGGQLVCCGEPMIEINPNTQDGAKEKHVPVATYIDGVLTVNVGSVDHPMLDEHYIQWIMIKQGDKVQRKILKATEKPQAIFKLDSDLDVEIYEYCNLHGVWKTDFSIKNK